jgi:hypothetical protein
MAKFRTLNVPPEIYDKVKQIAKTNGRTIGGQVATWTKICQHSAAQVRLLGESEVRYPPDGKVRTAVKIWQCQDCGWLIVLPADQFDGDQRALAQAQAG